MNTVSLHKKHEIIYATGDFDVPSFDLDVLKSHFKIEYAPEVYRLTLEGWGEFPHYAIAYYHEGAGQLLLSAMTDRGYSALVARLKDAGFDLSDEPDVRIHISMLKTAKDILKKDISLNPYEKLFPESRNKEQEAATDKINELLAILMPEINAGTDPDVAAAARKTGVDIKVAQELVEMIMLRIKGMGE